MQKKRITYIDIAKGIGMLAVIWGHIYASYSSPSIVLAYAFDIPLFLTLAGMMYDGKKYDTLSRLVMNRTRSLLIPYLLYSLITWGLWGGMQILTHTGRNVFPPLLQTIIAQGSGGFLVHNVPLWFVTCLFVVEVIYYFVSKTNDVICITLCILMAVIGYFMVHNNCDFDFTRLPWNIEVAMSSILFYCVGNVYAKKFGLDKIIKLVVEKKIQVVIVFIACSVIFTFGALFNGHITLGSNVLGKSTILLYFNGFIGSILVIILSALISNIKKKGKVLITLLTWIGKHSFDYMAIHVPIKGILSIVVAKLLHSSSDLVCKNVYSSLLVYALTLIVSTIVVYMISCAKNIVRIRLYNR